jgi:hypothetical protein
MVEDSVCNKLMIPSATSRVAKDFLSQNNIHLIEWLSNSPDLNSIENMWQIVKKNVEKRMPKDISD